MRQYIYFLACFLITLLTANAQNTLVSGPMLGYSEHREALIWLEVSPKVEEVSISYWKSGETKNQHLVHFEGELGKTFNPIKIVIGGLDMNTTYDYSIFLNKKQQNFDYPLQFNTKKLWEWREDPPKFSFLMGSCTYINDSTYDRPGKPYGKGTEIFKPMSEEDADFMLWLGDNTYLREADWSSEYGIQYRFHHTRKHPDLQAFWAKMPHYAIWDDHDFGPNNSNKSFEMKDIALQSFTDYWGNRTYGEANNKGTYGKFTYGDAEFYLLDSRYHRSADRIADNDPNKDFLGEKQMEWLKNSLLSSYAPFKFIANGSQILNAASKSECMQQYQAEYKELMDFITEYQIEGVVFLTGDRHFAEMIEITPAEGFYPLRDITSSPLTAGTYNSVLKSEEVKHPSVIKETILPEHNYIKITLEGKRKKREMTIQAFDKTGKERWKRLLKMEDFQVESK
ncbi:MAG: alkaline phosphatase D family protein [Chitinophagales bacterium]